MTVKTITCQIQMIVILPMIQIQLQLEIIYPIIYQKSNVFYCNSTSSNKTFKIFNDANVPNYLYNEIIDWAVEVQLSNIDFADVKNRERNSK